MKVDEVLKIKKRNCSSFLLQNVTQVSMEMIAKITVIIHSMEHIALKGVIVQKKSVTSIMAVEISI